MDRNCGFTLVLANHSFQTVGVYEELARPVEILERCIVTRYWKTTFYRAAGFERTVKTHGRSHVAIGDHPGLPETHVAGCAVEQKPASCHLHRTRQARPRNRALPLTVEPTGQKTVRPQRGQGSFRRTAGLL